jgi:hypothetical protein
MLIFRERLCIPNMQNILRISQSPDLRSNAESDTPQPPPDASAKRLRRSGRDRYGSIIRSISVLSTIVLDDPGSLIPKRKYRANKTSRSVRDKLLSC